MPLHYYLPHKRWFMFLENNISCLHNMDQIKYISIKHFRVEDNLSTLSISEILSLLLLYLRDLISVLLYLVSDLYWWGVSQCWDRRHWSLVSSGSDVSGDRLPWRIMNKSYLQISYRDTRLQFIFVNVYCLQTIL